MYQLPDTRSRLPPTLSPLAHVHDSYPDDISSPAPKKYVGPQQACFVKLKNVLLDGVENIRKVMPLVALDANEIMYSMDAASVPIIVVQHE